MPRQEEEAAVDLLRTAYIMLQRGQAKATLREICDVDIKVFNRAATWWRVWRMYGGMWIAFEGKQWLHAETQDGDLFYSVTDKGKQEVESRWPGQYRNEAV